MSAPGLFKYPKQRHTRSESPPLYKSYRDYRPYLDREFAHTCVYCRRPNLTRESGGFEIDHYLPKKHFQALASTYSNLYLACRTCNGRKTDAYPLRPGSPAVPNPCDQVMFDHLRYQNETAVSHSDNGAYAVQLLQLNETVTFEARKTIRRMADAVRNEFRGLESEISEFKTLASGGDGEAAAEVLLMESQINELRKLLARFGGGG